MKTEKKKLTKLKVLIIVLAAVIVFYVAPSIVIANVVFSIVFDRSDTPEYSLEYDYSDLKDEYPRQSVEFTSGNNVLRGYIYGEGDAPVVIVVNGLGAGADTHLGEIMFFVDNGWRVLAYNSTGVRESDGDSIKGVTQVKIDLEKAIDFVRENYSETVLLYGHSLGAYATASVVKDKNPAAAVCLCGFDTPNDLMVSTAKENAGPIVYIGAPFLALKQFFLFGTEGFISAKDELNAASSPVLVVDADSDETIPYDISITSKQDSIKNDKVTFITESDLHSTVWLSADAKVYRSELSEKYGHGTKEEAENADIERANELDLDFMNTVNEFFLSAVK